MGYRSDEWPVRKPWGGSGWPISCNLCSAFAAAAAMATPSVISRVRRLGSTLKLPSARATISSSEWSSMLRGETLSDTPTSIPSSSQRHSCASAESMTPAVSGWMIPVSSVIGMPGVRGEHGELVAAQTRDGVRRAQRAAEASGHLLQQAVAAVVTERVVDVLESIEVEKEDPEHLLVAPGCEQRLPQAVAEQAAVG